jgi:release factor glutamine methyltransferase
MDVGTGSGCIAITLAKELPSAELWAIDVSQMALVVALANARRHDVEKRIRFLQGDLFSSITKDSQSFDLIVSNPPYVTHPDLAVLQPEVRDWEPRGALDGGRDGLDFYRRLVKESPAYLRPGGWLVMELGAGQCLAVMRLIQAQGNFQESFSVQDYAGLERVIVARRCV